MLDESEISYFMIEKLPHELILRILSFLSYKDLNVLTLVSPWMYHMVTEPILWRSYTLNIQPEFIELMLGIPRLSKLRRIHVTESRKLSVSDYGRKKDFSHVLREKHQNKETMFTEAIQAIQSRESIESLTITATLGTNLSSVPPNILSTCFNQLVEANLEHAQMIGTQIFHFFKEWRKRLHYVV